MGKARREYRAAHQLGTIDNILQSQSPAHRDNRAAVRTEKRASSDARIQSSSPRSKLQDRITRGEHSQQSRQTSSDNQGTFRHREQDRLCSNQRTTQAHSSRLLPKSKHERRSHSPQHGRYWRADSDRSNVPKLVEKKQESSKGLSVSKQSWGKRKRETNKVEDEQQHKQIRKKPRATSPAIQHRGQVLLQSSVETKRDATDISTITTIPQRKSRFHSVSKPLVQFVNPPSSNATPERESHLASAQNSTPVAINRTQAEINVLLPAGATHGNPKKRHRDETESAGESAKRSRRIKEVKTANPERGLSPASFTRQQTRKILKRKTQQQTSSARKAQAQAVRPESSFAPVTPNHECDLNFRDYHHDSVPVLYSSMIQHANDTELLNSPSEMLVLDALTAIDESSKPHTRATTIELLGRSPNMNYSTKVLNDVDLYLLESEPENQLHVATDRGLLPAAEYLKLIGVPETQPVRFEGRIPPWARAALCAREERRVVHAWGKYNTVREGSALKSHQIALMMENNVKAREQRGKEIISPALRKPERESTARVISEVHDEPQPAEVEAAPLAEVPGKLTTEDEPREIEILEAEPGHLPLPAGSAVIVYKIDVDDVWAYGRLCGTKKLGRFPISFTCPLDWSLDRFAGTDDKLRRPLAESTDPSEKGWNGLTHWMQQQGHREGPTWNETLAAVATKAKQERDRSMTARRTNTSIEPTSSEDVKVTKMLSAGIQADEALNNEPRADVKTAAIAAALIAMIPASEYNSQTSLRKASEEKPQSKAAHDTQNDRNSGPQVIVAADSTEAAMDGARARNATSTIPVARKDAELATQSGSSSATGHEVREAVLEGDAGGPKILSQAEQKVEGAGANGGDTVAVAPRDPFTVPRYNPFARNDDIEYDWGNSDEEL